MANSWRRERWDSLRLLTPNWQSRLPGYRYEGADPDGFMTMPEVVEFVSRFAAAAAAPVRTHTTVTSVRRDRRGLPRRHRPTASLRCRTRRAGERRLQRRRACRRCAQAVPASIACLTALDYRNPNQLPDGGVLVVGASATGVQLADEIQRSGRQVTLSVGEHVRLPRTYRGRDVLWWMDAVGRVESALRRDRRPDARARPAVAAARRDARARDARSQRARRGRRRDRRPAGRRARRPGALLRRPAQPVRARRPQDGAAAGHVRRVGAQHRTRCRRRAAGTLRADARAGGVAALPRSRSGEIRSDRLGDRLPPRLQLARRARRRSQGPSAPRWRRGRGAGALCDRAARSAAPQVDLHPRRRRRRPRHRRSPGWATLLARRLAKR